MLDAEMSESKKNQQTNKQTKKKMGLFLLQKYTILIFSITTAAIAWKFTFFVLLNKSIDVLKIKFLEGATLVLHIKLVKGIVAPYF